MTATGGPLSMRPWAAGPSGLRRRRARFAAGAVMALPISVEIAAPCKAAGGRLFERFSTARQARIGHEIVVGIERLFARRRLDTRRGTVGQEGPALLVVLEISDHDLVEHLLVHGGIEDRTQRLD